MIIQPFGILFMTIIALEVLRAFYYHCVFVLVLTHSHAPSYSIVFSQRTSATIHIFTAIFNHIISIAIFRLMLVREDNELAR